MNLTSVGYYREMPDGSPCAPSIKDSVYKGDASGIDKICDYLDHGIPIILSPGVSTDVIDETKGTAGSLTVLTDGKWAWSGTLSYYVKNYNLLLNAEFINTMESNGWKIPIEGSESEHSTVFLDGVPIE